MDEREMGRFDRSFVIRMIRDFFFLLLALIALELAVNLGLQVYAYATEGAARSRATAERLASDLKDIMLNRGGPVAARTIYPTWQRMYENMGYDIALVPTEATVESIRARFDFEPRGIPADFPEGRHHEARATVRAEPFCINCHVEAEPGDALGHVRVRRYLGTALSQWMSDARTTGLVGMVNIIVTTVLLYLLLKVRMGPLLAVRGTLARLAKGRVDLSYRADVRSTDEFGELANDLNHFLERMSQTVEDLRRVVDDVGELNRRLEGAASYGERRLSPLDERARTLAARGQGLRRDAEAAAGLDALHTAVAALELLARERDVRPELREALQEAVDGFRARAAEARAAFGELDALVDGLDELCVHTREYEEVTGELAALAERVQGIAERGRTLLARVTAGSASEEAGEAPGGGAR